MLGVAFRHKINNTRRALADLDEHARKRVLSMCFRTLRIARDSIQISPDPSAVGQPPHSRDGTLPRSTAFDVVVNSGNPSAVLGPIAFAAGAGSDGDITRALEHGGETEQQDGRRHEIGARPWVEPALETMHRQVRDIWRNDSL